MDGLKTSRAGVNSSERSDGDSSKNRGSLANEQRRFFGTIVGDPCGGGEGYGTVLERGREVGRRYVTTGLGKILRRWKLREMQARDSGGRWAGTRR